MKTVLCDVSPLIFLSKLNYLKLIGQLLGNKIHVLQCVADEVLLNCPDAVEKSRLSEFIDTVQLIDFKVTQSISTALSLSDQSSLTWAVQNKVDILLADERLLRKIAAEEGIRAIGFLGLLVSAGKSGNMTAAQVRQAVDDAVSKHPCRISIRLYQRVLKEIDSMGQ
jgi:predicted nucleic acid-binding protein